MVHASVLPVDAVNVPVVLIVLADTVMPYAVVVPYSKLVVVLDAPPVLVRLPPSVADVVVTALADVVVTVGAPIGHALVVNESVAPPAE